MPKSRGRRPRGGDKKAVRRSPRRLRRSDLMLRDARQITGLADPLRAEVWASGWLGQAWLNAPMGEREAEHQLCMEVSVRACATPSPHGLAAVAALARVAPAADIKMLAGTIDMLSETPHADGTDLPDGRPPHRQARGPGARRGRSMGPAARLLGASCRIVR